ncbi:MAG TPA: DUF1648 domain-containing protein [Vicinamibacterales bacterium]|jgi:uncharacterized membrane protein|nr:DUF1648 domain-containing protein [Vicinamibacterales bacterium]
MIVRPSALTRQAVAASLAIVVLSAGFLLARYTALPDILPVHFTKFGFPDGWQYKTYARVLMPVFVQIALLLTFGSVGTLLLSRPRGSHDADGAGHAGLPDHDVAPDAMAASAAAEAIALISLVWVAFQAYAAFALEAMWERQRAGLGLLYTILELTGLVATILVFARANARFGRPTPRPFVPEHWRFGQLYNNSADPALFVPTRDGTRWTLNFGRPVAAALMGILLTAGIIGPVAILSLLLR